LKARLNLTLFSAAAFCAAASLLAQGPLRPRPRPPGAGTAAPRPSPPAPRVSHERAERDTFRYVPPSDPLLAKAIAANFEFQQELPDFVCLERVKRSSSENLGKKWKQDDVVEAEILTIGGKAQFGDIKIDGKPTGAADMSQIGGTWSNGEYAQLVVNLFNPRSRTQFTKQDPDKIGDREALVYDYKIEEEYSQWNVRVNGRLAIPAYHGKVWIDVENGRVLRIDNEATYLPYDFPLSSAAGVMHYGDFEIDGQSYLLPARALNKMCQRGSPVCKQLDIEFLDYRKFTSESSLFTTDSDIEFGQEVPEQLEPETSKEK
jgi:hypothetical protein